MTDCRAAAMRSLSPREIESIWGGVMAPLDPATGQVDPNRDCIYPDRPPLPGSGQPTHTHTPLP